MLTFERSSPFVFKCDCIKKYTLQNDYFLMCTCLFYIYLFMLYKVSTQISFSDQAEISLKGNFHSGDCSFIVKKI